MTNENDNRTSSKYYSDSKSEAHYASDEFDQCQLKRSNRLTGAEFRESFINEAPECDSDMKR